MNRSMSLFRLFLFLILISGVSYSQITLTLPSVSGMTGTDITNAAVSVSDLTGKNITNYQIQINYNPSIIKIYGTSVAGTLSSGGNPSVPIDTINGTIRIVWASSAAITGSGTLIKLKIKIKAQGTGSISYAATGTYPSGGTFTSLFGDGTQTITAINGTAVSTGNNTPPTLNLNPTGPYTIPQGQTLTVQLSGTDTDAGDVVTYAFSSVPTATGATINAATGAFSWTPSVAGTYSVTFTSTDGKSPTNITTTITVTPNSAPTLTLNPTGPYAVDEGSTLTITAVGADVNSDVLVYSYTSNPAITGANFNTSTGVFSWTPISNDGGTYSITFKVTDGKVTTPTQVTTTITVNKVNQAPTLTLNPEGPCLVYEGQTLTITLVGTDPNVGDVLTYQITSPAILPAGVTLTGNVFSWTPNYDQGTLDPYNFSFRVKDQSGLSSGIVSIEIVVGNTNRAPVFTTKLPPGKIAITNTPVPIKFVFKYAATDPDGDNVFFTLASSPTGSSITADGEFTWAPTADQANKSYVVKVEVSDGTDVTTTSEIISAGPVVDVKNEEGVPTEYLLKQNYPNPFNPTTKIDYSLPKESNVKITVYDVLGKEVAVLVDKELNAGYHSVDFNASRLTSGLYIYRIQANDFTSIRKMLLMK